MTLHMKHRQLCSDAGAAPRHSQSTTAGPSIVCSRCSHEHLSPPHWVFHSMKSSFGPIFPIRGYKQLLRTNQELKKAVTILTELLPFHSATACCFFPQQVFMALSRHESKTNA